MSIYNKNSNGSNITYYHGTDQVFERFKKDIVWVSESPSLANQYADLRQDISGKGAFIKPVWISARRSFDADKLDNTLKIGPFLMELAKQSELLTGIRPDDSMMKEIHQLLRAGSSREESGPWYGPHDFWFNSYEKFGYKESLVLNELFGELGFDSISYTEENERTIGVLSNGIVANALTGHVMHGEQTAFAKSVLAESRFFEKLQNARIEQTLVM